MNFRYPFLSATLAVVALVMVLLWFTPLNAVQAVCVLALWQFAMICLSPRQATLFETVLSQEQINEFERIMAGIKSYDGMFRGLSELQMKNQGGVKGLIEMLLKETNDLRSQLRSLRKSGATGTGTGVRWVRGVPFVTDDCAQAITATFVLEAAGLQNGLETMIPDSNRRQAVLALAKGILPEANMKAALDPTTTPLPTIYVPQVIELVYKYGQARQYGTVFPLGTGTVKLPRLKAGEDDFGFLGAGTAGMSQTVPEKRVTAELVTFTANKCGGLIRIPYELEVDTFIPIGQFLARYIARQLAKLEDKTMFLADGTATYASVTGVGPYCAANPTYLLQLAAGKTKPSDAALADFRNLRAKVSPALLAGGFNPCYYMNPTFESLLVTFNTIGQPLVYRPADGTNPPTLDGWEIRWIGVSQSFVTTPAASAFLAFFGDLSYWFLGERGAPRIEVSREVFFATDEIAMRALERIDVEAMAIDAMATLQTAAA